MYQVYYHINSKKLFKGVFDSVPVEHIKEVIELLDSLDREDDSISIYIIERKIRVKIWGDKEDGLCTLEINDAGDGVNYYKRFFKDNLKKLSAKDLESYMADPKEYGFESESF